MLATNSVLERVIRPGEGTLPPDAARYLLTLGFSPSDQARCDELSDRAQSAPLSQDEQTELDDLLTANDVLMILKSKARLSLRSPSSAA